MKPNDKTPKKKQLRNECEDCRGTGMMFPDCEKCEGHGWVRDPSDGGTMSCPDCDGEYCNECTDELE